ncbi:DUF397 domain-containing protein [Nocardia sp. NPDC005978]|uniref:DUF397 domain-containing protein n=1 Tax=Nocardia sp. NPDC005978 TaxID=3156725 RepID=UPI0033B8E612
MSTYPPIRQWFKSSRSSTQSECVEVFFESAKGSVSAHWFKASRSSTQNECVEVYLGDEVGVRDSKNPGGPELWFTGQQWDSFLESRVWEH